MSPPPSPAAPPPASPTPVVCTFPEATGFWGEYATIAGYNNPYSLEADVQAVCLANESCIGYWERTSGEFYALICLPDGTGTPPNDCTGQAWGAGLPNNTVERARLKTCA